MKAVTLIALTLILIPVAAFAQSRSAVGFERLKTNVENAKGNLDDYKKNMTVVDGNISEIAKARAAAEEQRRQVASEVKANATVVGKLNAREKELNGAIQGEKSQIAAEEKRLQELEALIAKIKDNRTKREANIQAYSTQLQALQQDRKDWDARAVTLGEQEKQSSARVREMTAMENEWRNRKKGYEGEISRWGKQVEKEEKSLQSYQALAESKK